MASPLDTAVDRLVAAYRAAGLPPTKKAGRVEPVLAAIAREIAPLRLPDEVERFWRRVDPDTVTVAPYPRLTSPELALTCWTSHRDENPGMTPRLLFPVAYESHGFLFAELADGRGSGGAILEWAYAGSPFDLRFPSLTAYVDLLATMVEVGAFQNGHIEESDWADAAAVRLAAALPVPGFGHVRQVDEDIRSWPERWLASNGQTAETRAPRGATTTAAALVRGDAASGTIRGRVVHLVGSGAGRDVVVEDGTGSLDVWCPAAVCEYGPLLGRSFEFDVVVRLDHTEAVAVRPLD